jgi:hypothetical protein
VGMPVQVCSVYDSFFVTYPSATLCLPLTISSHPSLSHPHPHLTYSPLSSPSPPSLGPCRLHSAHNSCQDRPHFIGPLVSVTSRSRAGLAPSPLHLALRIETLLVTPCPLTLIDLLQLIAGTRSFFFFHGR